MGQLLSGLGFEPVVMEDPQGYLGITWELAFSSQSDEGVLTASQVIRGR
jgi:hypothetical protein